MHPLSPRNRDIVSCLGYRRLQIPLRREGMRVNHKKLSRVYREERLQVRRRGGRKRALGTRAPLAMPRKVAHSPAVQGIVKSTNPAPLRPI
jgi:transposase InsO family protein